MFRRWFLKGGWERNPHIGAAEVPGSQGEVIPDL